MIVNQLEQETFKAADEGWKGGDYAKKEEQYQASIFEWKTCTSSYEKIFALLGVETHQHIKTRLKEYCRKIYKKDTRHEGAGSRGYCVSARESVLC